MFCLSKNKSIAKISGKAEIFILFFFFITSRQITNAQSWNWANKVSGPGPNFCNAVCSDPQNNSIIAGAFSSSVISFGNISLFNTADENIYIAKFDPNGNVLWAKNTGDSAGGYATALSSDTSGNIFVAGVFASAKIIFGNDTLYNSGIPGNTNGFLVKYSPNGIPLWAESISGSDITSICTDRNGNVYAIGNFSNDSLIIGNTILTNTNLGYPDIFFAKYSNGGNNIWARSAHSSAYDIGRSIIADKNSNVYITGLYGFQDFHLGNNIFLTPNSAYRRFFIAKYDSNGVAQWARDSDVNDNEGHSICLDTTGSPIVVGYFNSIYIKFGNITLYNTGNITSGLRYNGFITKYDSSGNVQFAHCIKGDMNWPYDNSSDTHYFYVTGFTGYSISIGGQTLHLVNPGDIDDMFILKFDFNGNLVCSTMINGGGYFNQSVAAGTFDNAFIAGSQSSSPLVLGTNTLSLNPGNVDRSFLANLTCLADATNLFELNHKNSIRIFPNPTNSLIELSCAFELNDILFDKSSIIDVYGKKITIKPIKFDSNSAFFDLSFLPNGVYILLLNSENKILPVKIIKE